MRKKILVAEDDLATSKILETLLKKWGFEVFCAPDGAQAWAIFQADPGINIIISDWMMPETDGIEFCKLVRGAADRHYTYFILLTAKNQIEDIIEGLESGADDFISKPFNQFELKVRIRAGERVVDLETQLENKVQELSTAYSQLSSGLAAAASMQQSILPPKTGSMNGLGFSSCYLPSEELGGDLFNIVELIDDFIGIYIFDVSGHGVPAALQSVALGRMLTGHTPSASLLLDFGSDGESILVVPPKEVMSRLNSRFQSASSKGDFVTFLYGVLQKSTGQFTYTRAGHPSPLIYSKGEKLEINDIGDIPIGIVPDYKFNENTIKLEKGYRLFLYTDGIPEAPNDKGDRFGDERLEEILKSKCGRPIEESVADLKNAVIEFHGGPVSDDDMSILGIEMQ